MKELKSERYFRYTGNLLILSIILKTISLIVVIILLCTSCELPKDNPVYESSDMKGWELVGQYNSNDKLYRKKFGNGDMVYWVIDPSGHAVAVSVSRDCE
jgi:hypothetical protein